MTDPVVRTVASQLDVQPQFKPDEVVVYRHEPGTPLVYFFSINL